MKELKELLKEEEEGLAEEPSGHVVVGLVTEAHMIELGISPQFPDSLVLWFPQGPHALVVKGEAQEILLTQMLGLLKMCGLLTEEDEEGSPASIKKVTFN